jgi:hypothetical protein
MKLLPISNVLSYPFSAKRIQPACAPIHFGQDSFEQSETPLNQELRTLTNDVNTGKITGLSALKTISVRYPNLSYHGTPILGITVLEPRQSLWTSRTGNVPDGTPAVSSTADFRPSIFSALIRKRIGSTAHYIDGRDGALVFKVRVTPEVWNKFKQNRSRVGIIHILNPHGMTVYRRTPVKPNDEGFQKLLEFRSGKPVTPLASMKVTMQDFLEMVRTDKTIRFINGEGKPLDPN